MDSVGLTIRHIIVPPPLSFQNMTPIDIINAARANYGKTTTRTVKRIDEILAEKLDNVRNFKTNPCSKDAECLLHRDCFRHTHG
jgi:hypothetical protein